MTHQTIPHLPDEAPPKTKNPSEGLAIDTEALPDGFDTLGLHEALLRSIIESGYEAPTPIQLRTIPSLLEGRDLIGQAQTGTGKTAAYALPLLQKLTPEKRVQALVLTPTRELAIQVSEAIRLFGKHLGRVRVLPIYGGQAMSIQMSALHRGVQVVVGTPGRVLDLLARGVLNLTAVHTVVLDEADEMLHMGFIEDVEAILAQTPDRSLVQTALFSATMPPEIRRVAARYLEDPVTVEIVDETRTIAAVEGLDHRRSGRSPRNI